MWFIWPIALIVVANIIYQICAKSVPKNMDTMASMVITYLVGALCSAIMFFIMNRDASLWHEFTKSNAAPVWLGISVVGLEVGFIYAYKIGWAVSTASIVQSTFLSLALLVVGAVIYNEAITLNKIIGISICLVGLYFISK